ncbi:MAG: response regulator transcription factor [Deltaproteobacteria bacterium]|nr:response regulator transcription factor [Deltaproteobacteria bacterium]
MAATRVLLVDDHALFLEGLRSLLAEVADIDVVGEARDGRAALQLCGELSPDVVIMDVTMPELNGIDAARRIRDRSASTRVIALSMHTEPRVVAEMLKAGATGYIPKASAPSELLAAIRTVAEGQTYLSPDLDTEKVSAWLEKRGGRGAPARPSLSSREREVVQLLAEGKSTAEIAMLLGVGTSTIETYRRRVLLKLGLRTLADLVRYAVREGLTTR